jgi:hypothetical protein
VVVNRGELGADPHVLVHGPLPGLLRKRVPGAELHERIDDEVRRALRDDLPGAPRRRVLGGLGGGEIGVGRLEIARERGGVQLRAELAEILIALGDLPEEEVRIWAHAGRRIGAQRRHPPGPFLDDLCEGVLAGDALLDRKAPPGRIDPVEGVRDVLATHEHDGRSSRASRLVFGVWSA